MDHSGPNYIPIFNFSGFQWLARSYRLPILLESRFGQTFPKYIIQKT
jgi:hypothetical protein